MNYFEEWKQIVQKPGEAVKRLKGRTSTLMALGFVVILTALGYANMIFGPSGLLISRLTGVGQPALLAIAIAAGIVFRLLYYMVLHSIAKRLGGKGNWQDIVGIMFRYSLPFAVLSFALQIPLIGLIFAFLVGLAGIYGIYILYKIFTIGYGLSLKRSIATIVACGIAMFAIGCVLAAIVGFIWVTGFLASGGTAPIITETAYGYHYYSPLHGGYSFDYARGWTADFAEGSANGSENKALGAITKNAFADVEMLVNEQSGRKITLIFMLDPKGNELACDNRSQVISRTVDARNGKFSKVTWGTLEGCLMEGIASTKDSRQDTMFVTTKCADGYTLSMGSSEDMNSPGNYSSDEAVSAMKAIVETMRCGKDAIK